MSQLFEFAAGSIAGRSHRIAGRNNQDTCCRLEATDCSVAVVCDGCGSGEHSEVGAKLGAPLVARAVLRHAQAHLQTSCGQAPGPLPFCLWESAHRDVLDRISVLAANMGDSLSCTINDYFLFTVVGVLITPLSTACFALGDGVIVVNDEEIPLGMFPGNAPPYLAYGLVESSLEVTDAELLRFQIHRSLPTAELRSFLIGTDGVQDLMKAAARNLPGKTESVGPLRQFWQEDRYFANPDMIRRRLAAVNRDVVSTDNARKEAGLLRDDTTLIVGRRKFNEQAEDGGAA